MFQRLIILSFLLPCTFLSGQIPGSIKPERATLLPPDIPEGSGLILWNDRLWTHNDSGDNYLFMLDTTDMSVKNKFTLPSRYRHDREEISQDSNFIYIADIGNNQRSRDTLQIQLVDKKHLLTGNVTTQHILFTWPMVSTGGRMNRPNYDCEAMVVSGDSIWLFTKEWKRPRRSQLFVIPRTPGVHEARFRATIKTRLLITGAAYHADSGRLVLCGYNKLLRTKLLIFDMINGTQSLFGKPVKVKLKMKRRQVEGIATENGHDFYIINEKFDFLFLHSRAKIHSFRIP